MPFEMRYRALGKTGLRASVVGIETHQWSGMGGKFLSVSDARAILKKAEKAGINFIDTGECYFFHAAERLIGEALGRERDRFIIATKFGHRSAPSGPVAAWTGEEIKISLENSLKALKTDWIDIYQAHINSRDDLKIFRQNISEVNAVLEKAKDDGKVRSIGVSLGDDQLFDKSGEILAEAVKNLNVQVAQVVYNRLNRLAEENILPLAKKSNLGVIVRGPLAKGYLSSRFKPTNKNYDSAGLAEVEKVRRSELPAGIDLAEWAIAWCLKTPLVSTVVPGCTAPEQVDSTVRAAGLLDVMGGLRLTS